MSWAIVALAGCARPTGPVFEPISAPLRWPGPPETARIEYVGTLRTNEDLKRGRSLGEGIGEMLFGKKPALGMLTPIAVCTDGGSRVFVCDSNAQLVHVYDLDVRSYEQWRPDPEIAAFAQPVAVAFDPRGRLLVSDSVAGTIFAFDSRGGYLGEFGREHLVRPCGLAVDPGTGRIFVADTGMHDVAVLALDGELIRRIGSRGVEPGRFNFPTYVALDGAGRLYVSDSLNFRVQVFDGELRPVRQIGTKGDLPGYFSQPKGIAVDRAGRVFVVDVHFEAVQIFDEEGRLLLAFGEEGSGPGQFWLPAGIHVDATDRIWVADSYNQRVQVFRCLPEDKP